MSGVPHWILNAGNEKLRRYATDAMTHQTRTWAKEELERRACISRAKHEETMAKASLDYVRKAYAEKKAERLLIETDLKKIGWKAPIAAKPAKVKKS